MKHLGVSALELLREKQYVNWRKTMFINYYECTGNHDNRKQHVPIEWQDIWECQCNDKCSECNAEVEPYQSEEA